MTADEKLSAILAAVQVDPGNRGLAELFPATAADFAAACRSIAETPFPSLVVTTGFYIPAGSPPAFETDGPLGAAFLARAFSNLGADGILLTEDSLAAVFRAVSLYADAPQWSRGRIPSPGLSEQAIRNDRFLAVAPPTHLIAVERVGPNADGRCLSMRGRDVTEHVEPVDQIFRLFPDVWPTIRTIGIGDGGNEIGMGKLPHDLVAANVPNGDRIHCRVPADYLIVAGVSNWGAYALAAGVYVIRGRTPPADLFDPDREREILEVMVRAGPLVDGVTGRQTATVDGLTWAEYAAPLARIRDILRG